MTGTETVIRRFLLRLRAWDSDGSMTDGNTLYWLGHTIATWNSDGNINLEPRQGIPVNNVTLGIIGKLAESGKLQMEDW